MAGIEQNVGSKGREILPAGETEPMPISQNQHDLAYPAPLPGEPEPVRPDVNEDDLGYN